MEHYRSFSKDWDSDILAKRKIEDVGIHGAYNSKFTLYSFARKSPNRMENKM